MNSFEKLFHKRLADQLAAAIAEAANSLAMGDARRTEGVRTTGECYENAVGYVRGLRVALDMCQQVEDALMGREKQ